LLLSAVARGSVGRRSSGGNGGATQHAYDERIVVNICHIFRLFEYRFKRFSNIDTT
jgi:hypothetical protein